MSAYLIRPLGALSLLILATVVIAAVLSAHSVAKPHPVAGGSAQSAAASSGADYASRSATAGVVAGSEAAPCDGMSTPRCCTAPVGCSASAILVPKVLAADSAPAPSRIEAGPLLPLHVGDQTPPAPPSLTLLSISRT